MTGENIKKFVFHDAVVHEQTLKEYFDQIGMKIEDSITFDDFFKMIKDNTQFGGAKNKTMYKRKESKYAFKGPVIDEGDEEDGDVTPRVKADNEKKNEEEKDKAKVDEENGGTKLNGEIKANGI